MPTPTSGPLALSQFLGLSDLTTFGSGELVMVIGDADTGKTTLAQELFRQLSASGHGVAFLDGDPGQSTLGPPTTVSLAFSEGTMEGFPPSGVVRRRFVEAVSPRGHLLPLVAAAARLVAAARRAGARVILYDTTGLIRADHGGLALKLAKIEILEPTIVIALQRNAELEALLSLLRHRPGLQLIERPPIPGVQPRDRQTRRAYRAAQFARHFSGARPVEVDLTRFASWPRTPFVLHQLVALEDAAGYTLALGILLGTQAANRQALILTALDSLADVATIHLGDLTVDPRSFEDQPLPGK